MGKIIRSFRAKMLFLFGVSILLSGGIIFLLYKLLQMYYHTMKYEHPLNSVRYFIRDIGDVNFFLLIFTPLAILFFFLFTKRYAAYFNKISDGINQLANGDFASPVHIDSNDEFGVIAKDINLAKIKLQQAVERGDFAENSKDQLVMNLAHDLRTPLTSILGYLDLILRDKKLTEEQINHYTDIAYTKSQRLEKLIDQLFEVTRMNYGTAAIERHRMDVSELLMQVTEELYPVLEKNGLQVRLNIPSHMFICGNGKMLARVFENLLSNANRYGSDGKFVDIQAQIVLNEVIVKVINYGDPIKPEHIPHLFDMFYTADQSRSQQGDSTGLGLFITKNIISQHDGTISVQSDAVRTMFEVRLPSHNDDSLQVLQR